MSEFPDWMEDYFGLWLSPYQGVILDESMEVTPEAWDYLVQRMRREHD